MLRPQLYRTGNLTLVSETFSWESAVPRGDVGNHIENAFWHCSPDFEILSSRGIVPCHKVRIAPADLSFIEELPVVPEPLLKAGLIKSLRAGGDLKEVQTEDIVEMLEKCRRTRTPNELVSLERPASASMLKIDIATTAGIHCYESQGEHHHERRNPLNSRCGSRHR